MKSYKTKRTEKGNSLIAFPEDYSVIDLETTGLDPKYCNIIEFAALKVRNNKVVDSFQSFVNIGFPLDDFIIELTGITDEMLANAPKIEVALKSFINFVGDDVLIGHNINFDINFIYDSLQKYQNKFFSNSFVDTLRLCRRLLPELNHHRLRDMKSYFSISTTIEHRALEDCQTCLSVFYACKELSVERYGSVESFLHRVNKSKYYNRIDIKSILPEENDYDTSGPLYRKECVFTGALQKLSRKDAMQIVVNQGGLIKSSVTKNTNYLILGDLDFCKSIKDGKSSKQKRAEMLKLKGQDIDIISEQLFYDMIGI